ncbi:hypothetical protein [Nesterenkonia haasae]|nr:hypothetical protein [Nesterenkonia haasae]
MTSGKAYGTPKLLHDPVDADHEAGVFLLVSKVAMTAPLDAAT